VDLNKLTTSDKVIGGSAIALFIFSFFPWYEFSIDVGELGSASATRNGWHYFLFGVIPVLLAIAIVVIIALQRFTTVELPDLPVTWAQIFLGAAGLAALLILLRLAITDKVGGLGFHLDGSRKFGLFLSLLAAIGLVVGAYMKMQEPAETSGPPPAI
jgi:hypothetical protein